MGKKAFDIWLENAKPGYGYGGALYDPCKDAYYAGLAQGTLEAEAKTSHTNDWLCGQDLAEQFICKLINQYEGETVTEENLQLWYAELLTENNPALRDT